MDLSYLAKEVLINLEKGLERISNPILNEPNHLFKDGVISVKLVNESLNDKIIIPACFALSNWVNGLDKKFNTFVRVKPESNQTNWARMEIHDIGVTVLRDYKINDKFEMINIQVRITTE